MGALAIYAWRQRTVARRQAEIAKTALARSLVKDGAQLFEESSPDEAMAYFAWALGTAPDSVAGSSWISDLLVNRIWLLPRAPLKHGDNVNSAAFSPDGKRVVTASDDRTARIWHVLLSCCASQAEADRLATLAEAVGGYEVSDTGSLSFIGLDEQRRRLKELGRLSGTGQVPEFSVDWIIRRFAQK